VKDDNGNLLAEYTGMIGFQMTVGATHGIMDGPEAANEFERFLAKVAASREPDSVIAPPWYIFVVPENRYSGAMSLRPIVKKNKRYYDLVKQVRIFVMQIPVKAAAPQVSRTSIDDAEGELNKVDLIDGDDDDKVDDGDLNPDMSAAEGIVPKEVPQ
jgi:hypothetical protein